MTTIWKYPLSITDHQVIDIPGGCEPLHVGLDPVGVPCLWVKVDPERAPRGFHVYIVGTGNPMPDKALSHLGSFSQGVFVWHVFTL